MRKKGLFGLAEKKRSGALELRNFMKSFGVTVNQAAILFRTAGRNVERWLLGRNGAPSVVLEIVRGFATVPGLQPQTAEWVRRLFQQASTLSIVISELCDRIEFLDERVAELRAEVIEKDKQIAELKARPEITADERLPRDLRPASGPDFQQRLVAVEARLDRLEGTAHS